MDLYLIFLYSNLVPASPPEDVKIDIYNKTIALVTWRPPPKRELHGELKGFKLLIDCNINNGDIKNETSSSVHSMESISSQLNFTLDSDTHTLTFDISINTTYHVQIAAYNRQGIGPFSAMAKLKVCMNIEKIFDNDLYNIYHMIILKHNVLLYLSLKGGSGGIG